MTISNWLVIYCEIEAQQKTNAMILLITNCVYQEGTYVKQTLITFSDAV